MREYGFRPASWRPARAGWGVRSLDVSALDRFRRPSRLSMVSPVAASIAVVGALMLALAIGTADLAAVGLLAAAALAAGAWTVRRFPGIGATRRERARER